MDGSIVCAVWNQVEKAGHTIVTTIVTVNTVRQVKKFQSGHARLPDEIQIYKTVNIYSFSRSSWQRITARLDQHIAAGKVNTYYETVFAEMVGRPFFRQKRGDGGEEFRECFLPG